MLPITLLAVQAAADCTPSATIQAFSFVGAALILVGYVGHQLRLVNPRKPFYNLVNAAGSGILGWVALRPFQLGFVILEFAWVVVSLYAMYRSAREDDAKDGAHA